MKIPSGYYKPFYKVDDMPLNITVTGCRHYDIWCYGADSMPPYGPTSKRYFGMSLNETQADFLVDLLNSLETSDDPTYYNAGWPWQQQEWLKKKETEGRTGGI